MKKKTHRPIVLKIISITIGLFGAAVLVLALNFVFDLRLNQKLYRLTLLYGPSKPLGIHRIDPQLGQAHIPNTMGRHTTGQFDVIYTIDAEGNRYTPGSAAGKPVVEVLGDSFTFGHGVEDNETYSAVLQTHWADFAIKNRAVMGAGAGHALLSLQHSLRYAEHSSMRMVIYGWLWFHNRRSLPGREQLRAALGQLAPYFEVVDGKPIFKRLLHLDDDLSFLPDDQKQQLAQEQIVIEALINEMAALCRKRGIRFVVVMLPGKHDSRHDAAIASLTPFLEEQSIEYINLQHDLGFPMDSRANLFFPYDNHPNPHWHRAVADAIASRLQL